MKGKKMVRGQITVFIILGIVLLLGVSTVVYFTSQQVSFREGIVVDKEAQPVYDYVASCISTITEEGVTRQGLQGGYVNIPQDIERTPPSYLPMDSRNTIKVPLWYFENEARVPTLAQMESDLSGFVQENLLGCLDNFKAFQYPVVANATPIVSTAIGDKVTVKVDYPVDIQRPERTVSVTQFVSSVDVRLKEAYDLAVRTMQKEDDNAWFENLTIDLMAGDSDIPMDSLEFDCSPKKWRLTDIRDTLQNTLRAVIPLVRVQNTVSAPFDEKASEYERVKKYTLNDFFQNRYPKNVPADQYEYARLQLDVGAPKSKLSAGFSYQPEWGLDINAQPNDNGVLSSRLGKGASKYLSFLCINQYHFTYDVIYPVLFSVRDPLAFKNKGFTFQMGFPVIINDNQEARQTFGYREFTGFEQSTGFCDQVGDQVVEVRASGYEPEIGVVELSGVQVDYQCVSQACTLGSTHADNGYYRLTSRLPQGCISPRLTVSKPGYLPASKVVTGNLMQFTMPRLHEFKIQVVKDEYSTDTKKFSPSRPLSKDEQVTLHVHAQNTTYDQYIALPGTNATVNLIDGAGTYQIDALLSVYDQVIGGYQNEAWTLTARQLAGTDTLTLHVIAVTPVKDGREYTLAVGEVMNNEDNAEPFAPVLS